jgi:hypothetical protein
MNEYLLGLGFTKTTTNPKFYYLFDRSNLLVLVLHIDDLINTRSSKKLIAECKVSLGQEFDMKDIGLMHYFLDLEVCHGTREVFLGQGKYTIAILKRFHVMDCNP